MLNCCPWSFHLGQELWEVISGRTEFSFGFGGAGCKLVVIVVIDSSNLREELEAIGIDCEILTIGLIEAETASYLLIEGKDEVSGAESCR